MIDKNKLSHTKLPWTRNGYVIRGPQDHDQTNGRDFPIIVTVRANQQV